MDGVKIINFSETKVGKRIKASKKKYSWSMSISGQDLTVDLYISKLSRKIKLLINNETEHMGKQTKGIPFQKPFSFHGHELNLIQQGKIFDLRIDGVSFDFLHMQNKTKSEFSYNTVEEEQKVEIKETPKIEKVSSPSSKPPKNPFDDLIEESTEPKELKTEAKEVKPEPQPKKLKPFAIKPPVPQQKNFGIFQPPEIQQTKTFLSSELFENPSKPAIKDSNLPSFPEVENPFKTGSLLRNNSEKSGFYTGNISYYK